jgi:hypothetical protein
MEHANKIDILCQYISSAVAILTKLTTSHDRSQLPGRCGQSLRELGYLCDGTRGSMTQLAGLLSEKRALGRSLEDAITSGVSGCQRVRILNGESFYWQSVPSSNVL